MQGETLPLRQTEVPVTVDIVVVSYNSGDRLHRCLSALAALPWLRPIVVDNASSDDSLAIVAELPVLALPQTRNGGFSFGCNIGWRAGNAPYVLLLNPDATISEQSLRRLVDVLEADPTLAVAAPRILNDDGSLEYSQRRFPRLRSTFAQSVFLHRLAPQATWSDELIRNERLYESVGDPDWVSGACLLVRRRALDEVGGLDERFFLYCEDKDLCKRLRSAGYGIRFEPDAEAHHAGGASAPRAELLPVLATSRALYAQKHESATTAALERLGLSLKALTHIAVSRGGIAVRIGHARALRAALSARSPRSAKVG